MTVTMTAFRFYNWECFICGVFWSFIRCYSILNSAFVGKEILMTFCISCHSNFVTYITCQRDLFVWLRLMWLKWFTKRHYIKKLTMRFQSKGTKYVWFLDIVSYALSKGSKPRGSFWLNYFCMLSCEPTLIFTNNAIYYYLKWKSNKISKKSIIFPFEWYKNNLHSLYPLISR